jgi:two-component system chemotaxis sensor kinase CheA
VTPPVPAWAVELLAYASVPAGVPLLAVAHTPRPTSDPAGRHALAVIRRIPGVVALLIDREGALPALEELDDDRPPARLRALTTASRADVDDVLRAVEEEEVEVYELDPADALACVVELIVGE